MAPRRVAWSPKCSILQQTEAKFCKAPDASRSSDTDTEKQIFHSSAKRTDQPLDWQPCSSLCSWFSSSLSRLSLWWLYAGTQRASKVENSNAQNLPNKTSNSYRWIRIWTENLTRANSHLQPISQSYHLYMRLEAPKCIWTSHLRETTKQKGYRVLVKAGIPMFALPVTIICRQIAKPNHTCFTLWKVIQQDQF